MYKLILTDMDGTFLNSEHELSEENIKAVKRAQEKGVLFGIVSGRPYKLIKPFVQEHNFNCYAVALNGAQIYNEEFDIISENYIDNDSVYEAIKIYEEEDILYQIYTSNETLCKPLGNHEKEFINLAEEYSSDKEEIAKIVEDMKKHTYGNSLIVEDIIDYIKVNNLKVCKMEVKSSSAEKLAIIKDKIGKIEDISITSSYKNNLEFVHKSVDKGSALEQLGEKLGVNPKEIIAIGDNLNDLGMIKAAGLGVAMGNAIDELKEQANFVTVSNDEHGVAQVIDKFILNSIK
ncbi:Cof-type HAD-IIB family hydrolase [Clostridium paridis]|uniref:HAD family phosphatase n=1 Tax=Clostridium paridis TaxID=2803863 RepID=A0A937K6B2_9CLOT|nr:Cof-type HAD-IIB family hydrolase [Clostridium paridis]MBL4933435.1 HAD family phosphatase [Clostridium paridis]